MQQIIQDFLEMVQIGCASRDERGIADYMKSHLEELGCIVTEDDAAEKVGGNAGNVIAYLPGELEGCVMLSSHMDRVSNGYNVKPQFHDGQITSDGTTILGADNVSGLASILDAVRRLKADGRPHATVEIVLSICEETGILGARVMDVDKLKSDMAFIMDSTGPLGQLDVKRPYKAMITVHVHGLRSHGGTPEKGINAVTAACTMLDGIREGRLDEESTSNLGVIHGGGFEPGTVCDDVEIKCEARSVSHDKLMAYLKYFEDYCKQGIAKTNATMTFSYEIQHANYCYTEKDPIVQLAMGALKEMGVEPKLSLTMEGCDGNIYKAHGIECISVGMGNSHAHALDEAVTIADLERAGELAQRMIYAYSAQRAL